MTVNDIAKAFSEALKLQEYKPCGIIFSDEKPAYALELKKKGNGCIVPLILKASTGVPLVVSEASTGWPCSAFYLGFQDTIFEGIEYFLSNKKDFFRPCEKFIQNPVLAKAFVDNVQPVKVEKRYMVIKPLEDFVSDEEPECVLFFVNADQLSALVFLSHYDAPGSMDRVLAPFASACMALVTLPLKLARSNEQKAVMGMFDISARSRMPQDLLSLSMSYAYLKKLAAILPESFLTTENWEKLKARN
ncbi:MAG: DUF169 domain-containing protein [Candidatus Saccharibacteria bacterium]